MLPPMPKLLYFAQLIDILGVSSEDLQLDVKPISVAEFSAKLTRRRVAARLWRSTWVADCGRQIFR